MLKIGVMKHLCEIIEAAAYSNNFEFIERTGFPSTEESKGKVAFNAVKYSHNKIAKNLVSKDNVNNNYSGNFMLVDALLNQNNELTDLILKTEGVKVSHNDDYLKLPIVIAAENNDLETMKILVSLGAELKEINNASYDPAIKIASINNNLEMVKYIVDVKGSLPNVSAELFNIDRGFIEKDNLEAINYLLDNDYSIDFKSRHSDYFPMAIRCEAINIVNAFIDEIDIHSNSFNLLEEASSGSAFKSTQILIEKGYDVNRRSKNKSTALIVSKCEKSSSLLLEKGAYINAVNGLLENSLFEAVRTNNPKLVNLLIDHGINVNQRNLRGEIPLSHAVRENQTSISKALILAGADTNVIDYRNETPLYSAIINKDKALIDLLIQYKADLFYLDEEGNNYIGSSVDHNVDLVDFLVTKGLDVDHVNFSGETPIFNTIKGNQDIINSILKYDINIDKQNNKGETALMKSFSCSTFLFKSVLSKNPSVILASKKNETVLDWISKTENHMVKGLIIIDYEMKNNHISGESLRFLSSHKEIDKIIEISKKMSIDVPDSLDQNVLFDLYENNTSFKRAIKAGVNINQIDHNGENILFKTIEKRSASLTDYLIESGVDVEVRNNKGEKLLSYALKSDINCQIDSLVKKAVLTDLNLKGQSALFIAISNSVVSELIDKVDVNIQDSSGQTFFMNPRIYKDLNLLEKTAKQGADFYLKDNDNKTLIDHATKERNISSEDLIQIEKIILLNAIDQEESERPLGL